MISAPRIGQRVRIHYRQTVAPHMPHHGATGTVAVAGRRRPRNHAVQLDDGPLVIVPAGNLRAVKIS